MTGNKENKIVSRACITVGMDDAPWLDPDTITEIIQSTPIHLRDTVKNGTPSLGSGAIYPVPLEDIVLKPSDVEKLRPLPAHWKYLYAMDVGWKTTAVVWLALDVDNDIMYVTDEYYQGKLEPEIHAARITQKGAWMPGVIDPAARGRSQVDGQSLLRIYRTLGLRLREADNEVEAGIYKVWSRLSTGRLKFFPQTFNLQSEYVVYRRDEEGKIIKAHDHALDALRYGISTFQMAAPYPPKNSTNTVGSKKYNV